MSSGSQTRRERARERRQARKRLEVRKRQRQQRAEAVGDLSVKDLAERIRAAQQLYPSEVGDPLIGEPPEAYGVIQKAVEAAQTQFWLFCKAEGVRVNNKTLKVAAQQILICLDLNYRCFAAGVDHGRHQVLGGVDQTVLIELLQEARHFVEDEALADRIYNVLSQIKIGEEDQDAHEEAQETTV